MIAVAGSLKLGFVPHSPSMVRGWLRSGPPAADLTAAARSNARGRTLGLALRDDLVAEGEGEFCDAMAPPDQVERSVSDPVQCGRRFDGEICR